MADFLPFYRPDMTADELQLISQSLDSGWITTGPKVQEFENLLREKLSTESVLCVNSCTAALHLGLSALGVGPGDEVITSPLTFCATANVIEHCGATPVLADVKPTTWQIDPEKIGEKITPKTKVILPVHFAGQVVDRPAIEKLAKTHHVQILEDAAHLYPTKEYTGSSTNLMAFSFYANKNITTAEGGALAGPAELVERVRPLSLHGLSKDAWKRFDHQGSWRYDVAAPGFKYNMTDIQASIGLGQMARMAAFEQQRQRLYNLYCEWLQEIVEVRTMEIENLFSYHIMPVIFDFKNHSLDRDQMITELKHLGIGTSMHYIPLFNFSYYQNKYRWNPEDYPNTVAITDNNMTLPMYTRMTSDDVRRVIDGIKMILAKHKR